LDHSDHTGNPQHYNSVSDRTSYHQLLGTWLNILYLRIPVQ